MGGSRKEWNATIVSLWNVLGDTRETETKDICINSLINRNLLAMLEG